MTNARVIWAALIIVVVAWASVTPSTYSDCRADAAKSARTDAAMRVLLDVCDQRFRPSSPAAKPAPKPAPKSALAMGA